MLLVRWFAFSGDSFDSHLKLLMCPNFPSCLFGDFACTVRHFESRMFADLAGLNLCSSCRQWERNRGYSGMQGSLCTTCASILMKDGKC